MIRKLGIGVSVMWFFGGCGQPSPNAAPEGKGEPQEFVLHARARKDDGAVFETLRWDARKTAVIICDMWDTHTCKSAARRVSEMVPRLNQFLRAARARGALVIHSPSDVVAFYEGTPQRKRAQEAPPLPAPVEIKPRPYDSKCEGPWPFDNSRWGCDDDPPCPERKPYPWTRENAGIEMADEDAVSDKGSEIYNLCQARGITNILMTGVHTNYCIVGRSFGIRQMVMLHRNIVLVRDLTDALYNPKDPPHVPHARGTELVIEHIERYWCPSILSSDLIRS
jgi:nicotinamidase-related amidase